MFCSTYRCTALFLLSLEDFLHRVMYSTSAQRCLVKENRVDFSIITASLSRE